MDAKEYQKFEAGDIPEDEELRCLREENRKLREAFNAAKNYIIKTDFDPDFSPKTNRAYLKYIKAKKVLDNVNTESI